MSVKEPYLIHVQNFIISGLCIRTKNDNEFDPQSAKLPKLWEQFYNQDIVKKFQREQSDLPIFGVYSNYDSDFTGFYTVTAGIEMKGKQRPPEFNSISIETGNYLIFENRGSMPQAIIKIWQEIWQYFSSTRPLRRTYITDFEIYKNPEECAVYIGVH
ncbi:GyrI-like domain-containing protein [Legionella tunisiensis]|uniref:GyrI-like domain-containing protein n=1 Tax=Legionella tunisiensis TaxID=1034944 RepID=UPI0003670892|nr:effector binding domain-containing protein [Legionella tunisiensis]